MGAPSQVTIILKNGDMETYYKPEHKMLEVAFSGSGYVAVLQDPHSCVCKKDIVEVEEVRMLTNKGWVKTTFEPYEAQETVDACL